MWGGVRAQVPRRITYSEVMELRAWDTSKPSFVLLDSRSVSGKSTHVYPAGTAIAAFDFKCWCLCPLSCTLADGFVQAYLDRFGEADTTLQKVGGRGDGPAGEKILAPFLATADFCKTMKLVLPKWDELDFSNLDPASPEEWEGP